ncbi:MAG: monovalent cation/H(+) antiporter subunit G [Burkholderiales bacterium]|nr:monovalent cation/H(+) antiporter subunit G [Burkholderiales bacterium]
MSLLDWLSMLLIGVGAFFFFAGTVGLLRLPDVYSRLHALSKIDNLGLGFVVAGLMLQSGAVAGILKLALIWVFALASSAVATHLVARYALRSGIPPWRRR